MYSHTFPHLSERFFKGSTWPAVESVLHLVDSDHVFGLLYKEMYYRHLYASTKPTIEQRMDSWDNYRELFSGAGGGAGGRCAAERCRAFHQCGGLVSGPPAADQQPLPRRLQSSSTAT